MIDLEGIGGTYIGGGREIAELRREIGTSRHVQQSVRDLFTQKIEDESGAE